MTQVTVAAAAAVCVTRNALAASPLAPSALPALKPILTTVLILDCVWWFKQYTLVYTMTAGGPDTATSLISLSIYGTAFNDLRFGKASAWGILVFVICYLINLVSKVVMKDDE